MSKSENLQLLSSTYVHIAFSSVTMPGIWWERKGKNWWEKSCVTEVDFIYYIVNGSIALEINGKDNVAHEGQMVYVPAGTPLKTKIITRDGVKKYYTAFNLSFDENPLPYLFKTPVVTDVQDKKTVTALFKILCDCHRDICALNGIRARGALLQLVAQFLEESHAEPILTGNKIEKSLQQVVHYINENLDKPLTVQELSKLAGYNKDYFTRLFKKNFDCLPLEYVAVIKINHAKKQLRNSNVPISAIAEELGFFDTSHFGKFFRRHIGISPTAYRKKGR